MANNFYNNAQFAGFYNNTNPKGCRLCNQVFTDTQALLTHVESHMAQEEDSLRRLNSSPPDVNSQMQLGSQQFPPQPAMGDGRNFQAQSQPMRMPQPISKNPIFNSSQIGSSSTPIRQMQVSPQAFPFSGSINGDGSKPYISKLEKPIKKIDFIDLVNMDGDDNLEVEAMDLDLKL
ncbi:hypothetical protein D0Y65_025597 [Glycine soja]|uniref:C2H2-type domain-containing protein n=1 Tax=Glycine soja TaxID=3848 RepID=A0A0B2PLR2_GLYSO|nr:hypothetical protein glysoja_034312 [Glycine soja]RZB85019.1 hypothetical protein D0Y65_025597 [Glycine soja]